MYSNILVGAEPIAYFPLNYYRSSRRVCKIWFPGNAKRLANASTAGAGIPAHPSAGNDYRYALATGHYYIVCTWHAAGSAERITMIAIKKNEPVRPPNTIERCINNVITNINNNSRRQSPDDLGGSDLPVHIILLLYSVRRDPFIPDSVSARVEHWAGSCSHGWVPTAAIMSKIEILSRPRATRLYRFQRGHRVNRVCCKSNRPPP